MIGYLHPHSGRVIPRRWYAAFAISLCALAGLAPARGSATFPGRPGRVAWAYAANDPNFHFSPDYGILNVRSTGGPDHVIAACYTEDGARSCPKYAHVSYSPDGRHLVWGLTTESGANEIVLAKADGADRTTIADPTAEYFDPSYSSLGDRLLFVRRSKTAPDNQLVTSDLHGAHQRLLTTTTGHEPAWSPDGRHILFTHGRAVWIVGANGRGARKLIGNAKRADWSPDSRQIVYVAQSDASIHTAHADGTHRRTLHFSTVGGPGPYADRAGYAVFSPDGKKIAFAGNDGSGPVIYVGPAQGGHADSIDLFSTGGEGTGELGVGLAWQPLH